MRTERFMYFCLSTVKNILNPTVVYTTDRSKPVVLVSSDSVWLCVKP